MALFEVRFRLVHDCPYTRFTTAMPQVMVNHWCSKESDVLEFSSSGADHLGLETAMRRLEEELRARVVRRIFMNQSRCLVVQKHSYSSMKQNVNSVIEDHNCMEVQPTEYRGGYEWYRILAFNHSDLLRLFGALSRWADVEVVSKERLADRSARDTTTVSMRNLLGRLTDKQLTALLVALSNGYYESPRRTRTLDISRKLKTPRTTYEVHLRKAEGKVLHALMPYIELVASASTRTAAFPESRSTGTAPLGMRGEAPVTSAEKRSRLEWPADGT